MRSKPTLVDFLPDWRDEKQYIFPKDMSPQQWAWQFLRRNKKYRGLWEVFFAEENPQILKKAKCLTAKRQSDGTIDFVGEDAEMQNMCASARVFYMYFGVLYFPPSPKENDPNIDFEPLKVIVNPITPKIEPRIQSKRHPKKRVQQYDTLKHLKEDEIALIFNIHRSFEGQIEYAKEVFEEVKQKRGATDFRMRANRYPAYLRILDAKFRYEKDAVIAKTVFPNLSDRYEDQHNARQRVRDNYEAARKLCDRDYRLLASIRNKNCL